MTVLSTVGTPVALEAMDARIDIETDDEIRDAMLLALDAARSASGKEVTREEISERVHRAAKKLESPIASWLDESRLPPLRYTDGTELGTGSHAVPSLPPVACPRDSPGRRGPAALCD